MRKKFLEFLCGAGFLAWAIWWSHEPLQPHLYGLAFGIFGVVLVDVADFLIGKRKLLGLYWDSYRPVSRPAIRLTIAYLFRIEVNGRYLLVKSHRIPNTYQPVGGVYKYYNPEARAALISLGAITDNHIPNDEVSECDLRLLLQRRRNLPAFLKWFFRKDKRETEPWREFYEELVEPGLLPKEMFKYIHADLVGQHFERIHWDRFFKIDTFRYADIYVPKFITPDQEAAVKALAGVESNEYIWVTEEEIGQGRTPDGKLIAEHTHKIFHTKKIHHD
jgi:SMODS-associated NUDIX domain